MQYGDLIELIRTEAESLVTIAPSDTEVPTCPGWTTADLYRHVGSVIRWQLVQITSPDPSQLQSAPKTAFPDDPEAQIEWLLDGVDQLIFELEAGGPTRQTSSWFGPQPALFWARRAAHEIAVHRWDVQASIMTPIPLDAEQARDAISELLEVIVPARLQREPWPTAPTTIHLHATDLEGEWMLHLNGSDLVVEHAHGKGEVAARGTASELLLLILGRLPSARLEIFGDAAVLDQWHTTVQI